MSKLGTRGGRVGAVLGTLLLASCGGELPLSGGLPTSRGSFNESALRALPNDSKNHVFKSYVRREKSAYATNWTRAVDLSGVSWNTAQTATLVSPIHVVMAKHFPRKVGAEVNFHTSTGEPVQRFIVKIKRIPGTHDVAVGVLNLPVPSGVRHYAVPSPGQGASLVGHYVLTTDQKRRVFRHEVARQNGSTLGLKHPLFDGSASDQLRKSFISGDSGNPTFYLNGTDLVLIETHKFGGAGSGPYYGDEDLILKVNAAMNELGGGYQLRQVSLR